MNNLTIQSLCKVCEGKRRSRVAPQKSLLQKILERASLKDKICATSRLK